MEPSGIELPGARARGTPPSSGRIRTCAEDFRVEELLGFRASGDGPHLLLRVEKTRRNTVDVVRMLAAYAGLSVRDVGYSGLKDKHAVASQWFTVPYSPGVDWEAFDGSGVRILGYERHHRKLRREVVDYRDVTRPG